ncbi:D-glycero-alpha-D-manno-heptose-1,7-bisphosphate 7-phosphatase [Adhaeribacter aquaticus]|uniref:D-glycero-alpha-D-manno-heptose-1,7-bisphosphate 7-phosphatase n=1 Tax=Adhaeribacter aquaticus TaxID=299567 RepID=UPI0003FAC916|nr:HAD-IIIA family hydrolase [Adhaeribacter aquaticus]
MNLNKCVFLDRDGVLNEERGEYTFTDSDFLIIDKVPEAIQLLKEHGYLLIVVTNQGGIAKGIYTKADVQRCHQKLQAVCNDNINAIYYAPAHPSVSASLARKPDSLMLERAIAKYSIDVTQSYLVGDRKRDMDAALKVGVTPIYVENTETPPTGITKVKNLYEAAEFILKQKTGM